MKNVNLLSLLLLSGFASSIFGTGKAGDLSPYREMQMRKREMGNHFNINSYENFLLKQRKEIDEELQSLKSSSRSSSRNSVASRHVSE